MANSGILASSRYPLAMSRNAIAPRGLGRITSRGTPLASIALTGGIAIAVDCRVPHPRVGEAGFCVPAPCFRHGERRPHRLQGESARLVSAPSRARGTPWPQIFGIAAPLILLSQMGLLPIVGAMLIVVGGVVWYRVFARSTYQPREARFLTRCG